MGLKEGNTQKLNLKDDAKLNILEYFFYATDSFSNSQGNPHYALTLLGSSLTTFLEELGIISLFQIKIGTLNEVAKSHPYLQWGSQESISCSLADTHGHAQLEHHNTFLVL